MSTINDLIQLADTLQRRKVEDRRYQDQRNMQLAQIAEAKNKENQVIQGQRFFNDMTSGLMKSGWDDEGKWTGESPDTNKLVETYLGNMDSLGLAGDSALALQRVGQFNQLRLQKAGTQLQAKFADWSANNPDAKPEDKAAYLSSINADKLYTQLYGLGGPVAATELTGISPDVFGAKNETPYLKIGGGVIASAVIAKYGGPKALNAIKSAFNLVGKGKVLTPEKVASVKQLMPNIKDPNARKVLDKIMNAQQAGDTKKAIKILERFNKKFPELNIVDDIVKGAPIKGTKPSSILRNAKKLLTSGAGGLAGGSVGYMAAQKLGDALTGEENSKTGRIGGLVGGTAGAYAVPAMLKKVGSKINEKGASWALKKVMEKGGPKLAAKFALKAGLSGFGTVASSGWGAAGAAAFLAADLYAISQILSEDE